MITIAIVFHTCVYLQLFLACPLLAAHCAHSHLPTHMQSAFHNPLFHLTLNAITPHYMHSHLPIPTQSIKVHTVPDLPSRLMMALTPKRLVQKSKILFLTFVSSLDFRIDYACED